MSDADEPEEIQQGSIETLTVGGDTVVALQKVVYPERAELDKRVWRGQVIEDFGHHVPREDRVLGEDTSFYVAAAKAIDAYHNDGQDMEASG